MVITAAPEAVGLSSARLEAAASVYESAIGAPDGVSAASMVVLRRGQVVLARGFGRVAPDPEAAAVEPSSVFMLASITKPVTAMALLLLVEEGRLSLEDPACLHLPEFSEGERASITVRDLLAHTSGLPDMLPENMALREARAPLSDFVAKTLTTPLLFTPGTDFSYQSMGILLAATIVERLAGQPMRDFMCAPAPFTTCPPPPHSTPPHLPLVCSRGLACGWQAGPDLHATRHARQRARPRPERRHRRLRLDRNPARRRVGRPARPPKHAVLERHGHAPRQTFRHAKGEWLC